MAVVCAAVVFWRRRPPPPSFGPVLPGRCVWSGVRGVGGVRSACGCVRSISETRANARSTRS
eukprot:7183139-Lingulodinium_polyedra.AAC.1